MAKPAQYPTWATAGTNNTEPSSGQKASGWTANQVAVSSYFNWVLYTIYLWIVYLDSGNWIGPITITGDLTVTGNFVVQGNSTLGNATSDLTTVSGDIEITRDIDVNGQLYWETAVPTVLPGAHWTTYTVDGNAEKHMRIQGASNGVIGRQFSADSERLTMAIPLAEGELLVSYLVWAKKTTNGSTTLSSRLYTHNMSTDVETASSAGTSTAAVSPGLISTLNETGLTVSGGQVGQVYLVCYQTGAAGGDRVYGVTYSKKRPQP